MKKIVFTGGGTAGHIMPNLAIIENLKDYEIYYLGSNGMEKDIISKYKNINFIEIPVVKFSRNINLKNLLIPFKLFSSINKTKNILQQISPCLIFSKGGFVSLPVCLAGNKLSIPVITHESDITVGLANKIIARIAKKICCSFSNTANKLGKKAIFTGSPIRKKITSGDKNTIIKRHNLTTLKPIILIIGGSQGARAINNKICDSINALTKKYTIIHIVGKNNKKDIQIKDYVQIEFANDIENYLAVADLIISRAGSNAIFEILTLAKPNILIPLPKSRHSRGDQELNAKYFEQNKFSKILKQSELNQISLLNTIDYVLSRKEKYQEAMKKANKTVGNDNIIKLIKKHEL